MELYKFPVFRKYEDQRSFFKIISKEEFIELKITGRTYTLHHIKAKILPERLLIEDMLNKANGHWLEATENEFEGKLAYCRHELKEIR